jgi:hypothetical protein
MGFFDAGTVATNACLVVPAADVWHFAILTSRMHMAWLGVVGGRLKSDFRYSKDVVYNNFVFPLLTTEAKKQLTDLGQAILDARAADSGGAMRVLYDPVLMPVALRRAHAAVDDFVDKLYRDEPFADSEERVRHLLQLHKSLASS